MFPQRIVEATGQHSMAHLLVEKLGLGPMTHDGAAAVRAAAKPIGGA